MLAKRLSARKAPEKIMTVTFEILRAGPALTIQDNGRPGYARFGLSAGGAMDRYALAEGAGLLDNHSACNALEMAGFGGRFRLINGSRWVALTGAPMRAAVDGKPACWRQSFELLAGQTLTIGSAIDGAAAGTYGYLSIAGGFDVAAEIGSGGTHIRAGIGGIQGKALQAGQQLQVTAAGGNPPHPKKLPAPDYFQQQHIRIMWGAQSHLFQQATRQRLLDQTFSIGLQRDRMAMRLQIAPGQPPFEALLAGLSAPVQAGDIQITGDGVAAVLVREHQPTGGYPRIATVISADLDRVAQFPVGKRLRFVLVSRQQAVAALQKYRAALANLATAARPVADWRAPSANLLDYNLIDGVVSAND